MKRKRKNPIPILLLWSKKEQLRFCNAVEQLVSAARDLAGLVAELRAERIAAEQKYARRRQARIAKHAGDQMVSLPPTVEEFIAQNGPQESEVES